MEDWLENLLDENLEYFNPGFCEKSPTRITDRPTFDGCFEEILQEKCRFNHNSSQKVSPSRKELAMNKDVVSKLPSLPLEEPEKELNVVISFAGNKHALATTNVYSSTILLPTRAVAVLQPPQNQCTSQTVVNAQRIDYPSCKLTRQTRDFRSILTNCQLGLREKRITKRKAASEREKERMRIISNELMRLKDHLPHHWFSDNHPSKISILRNAITYINMLQAHLGRK
ncbi:unnamed protein product [Clavelina lepadiformis]